MLTAIVAYDQQRLIGKDNSLLWHLPDDFKRFKQLTIGHTIIMGRKTFESLPGILPNRRHIIISRQQSFMPQGVEVANSLAEAIEQSSSDTQPFIIGGGEIYRLAMPYVQCLEITCVGHTFEGGDTWFPEIDGQEWTLVSEQNHDKDAKHQYSFVYQTYHRK